MCVCPFSVGGGGVEFDEKPGGGLTNGVLFSSRGGRGNVWFLGFFGLGFLGLLSCSMFEIYLGRGFFFDFSGA